MQTQQAPKSRAQTLDSVIIRLAGDSGDGIQVTGSQFTNESGLAGNDLSTLPNFPAEIRAPAGTLAGVSGFQINFGSCEIHTPGETPDVLVAMNPAALKSNLPDLKVGGILIINEDAFTEKNLTRVGYEQNPVDDEALKAKYKVIVVPIAKLTKEALAQTGLSSREVDRCKNFFTLGLLLWMFNRPSEHTLNWIENKFKKNPDYAAANAHVLKAGIAFGETSEIFDVSYDIKPAKLEPGVYKNINGTVSMAYGFIAAAQKSNLPLFFSAYPITPASGLLHELARYKQLGVTTVQLEDEIAAACAAIGASYAGAIGVTSSSGPGISLKAEAMGLAVITELPLVVVNVQRGGPSTGLPTKTEQADLLQALYGRHGEAPMCVIAASSPASAFEMTYEACRIAVKYMTPVMLLSDGYIANSSEPWKLPDPEALREFDIPMINASNNPDGEFQPYQRDPKLLRRPWAIPGTPHLEHRIGGIEKQDVTGNVSYDPDNHERMCQLRQQKIDGIAREIPPIKIDGHDKGQLLVIGWGGTEGTLIKAVADARAEGIEVSRIHLHFINPLPADLGEVLSNFDRVLIPEINFGQLRSIIRDKYLVDAHGYNAVRGQPLRVSKVKDAIITLARPQ